MHFLKKSMQRSSKRARVIVELKSMPSNRESISMCAWVELERVRLGRSQAAEGALVLTHVLAMAALEVLEEVVHHAVVKVLATKVCVACSGLDLKDTLLDGEEGHVKGASAKIKDQHILLLALLIQAIGNGSSRGFVDDAQDIQPRDGPGVLRGLALRVVEVSRNSHDGILHLFPKVGLSNLSHLGEDHGADLLGLELLLLPLVFDLDDRGAARTRSHSERPVLHV